jgi:peptidoglycan LD-endopeptidase CwlK
MTFQFSERSLQRLEGVHPDLVRVVKAALVLSKVDFVVVEGLRSLERQKELFAGGKSRTMNSRHLTGHAVDLAPLVDLDGDGKREITWERHQFYPIVDAMHAAASVLKVPLEWGGDWHWQDCPHWQLGRDRYP